MKLFSSIILLIAFMLMLIGHTLYESGKIENIYNLTENTLVWNYNYTEQTMENITDMTEINIGRVGRISNVIKKGVDFFGYTAMEVSKYFVEFGYNNPQYDYEFAIMLIKLIFILTIVSLCVPLVMPILLLLYLLFIGIKKLISYIYRNKYKGGDVNEK